MSSSQICQMELKDSNTLAIIIPAYNEASSIAAVLDDIKHSGVKARTLVVDDNSSDRTAEIATESGAEVLRLCTNTGAWGAMQAGIRYAVWQGYTQVVTLDGDGQHLAESVSILLNAEPGADVVIGSCVSRGSNARKLAWHYFRSMTRLPVDDLTSGLRLYRTRALAHLISRRATLLDYQDIGLLLLLRSSGLSFAEVNVQMRQREIGKSRIFSSWFRVIQYMGTTTLICLAKLFHRD